LLRILKCMRPTRPVRLSNESGTSMAQNRATLLCVYVCTCLCLFVQDNQSNAGVLSFWLANSSELLHFMKQDVDIGHCSLSAQNQLADTIQMTFSFLIDCFQSELAVCMPALLSSGNDDGKSFHKFCLNQ
jgi:afadin